jgi:C4-dicarboxylate transporter DctQ subunit
MTIFTANLVMNVGLRYLFHASMVWVEELSIYLMIWTSFLAAAVAFREGAHVSFTVLIDKLPKRIRGNIIFFNHVVILGFLAIMVYYGFLFAMVNWGQQTPAMRISKGIPYLSIPVGGILMILQMTGVVLAHTRQYISYHGR